MIAQRIDQILHWLKWPVAFTATAALPFAIWSMLRLLWDVLQAPHRILPFAIGVVSFWFLWKSWFARRSLGNWSIQFEHEVTHLLFAWLTWHRVVGFRASLAKGSHVKIQGTSNWLITSAPYFFPTLAVALWIVSWLLPIRFLPWTSLVLGFAVGYHWVSTIKETHREQDDLQQLSWRFCWLFLPTANLLMLGWMVAYSFDGTAGITTFVQRMWEPITYWRS